MNAPGAGEGAFRFEPGERETLAARVRQHAADLARVVVAIDGPGGSGKSSTARTVAERLGLLWLDTGAMYRSLTLLAWRRGVDAADARGLTGLLRGSDIRFERRAGETRVLLDGEDVSRAIRSAEVTRLVSQVSAHPEVRREMVRRQRELGEEGGVVLEGRDIGTVVFPDAGVKVFLTADLHTRAQRRHLEDRARGIASALEAIETDLRQRDHADSTRAASPLVRAPDATLLDTSGLDFEAQVDAVLALALRAVARQGESQPGIGAAPGGAPGSQAGMGGEAAQPPVLGPSLLEVDPQAVTQPGYRAFHSGLYRLVHDAIRLLACLLFGLRVVIHPKARLPGSALVASNHIAGMDPPLVGSCLPFELWFIAKLELFRRAWLARLIARFNAIPIRRGTADFAALERAVDLLRQGRNVIMFPEGTRQRTGRLGSARWGIGYVAVHAGRPIVPVYVRGSRDPRPRGLRRQPLEVWIGEPFGLQVPAGTDERQIYVQVGELAMQRIAGLMLRSAGRRPLPGLELPGTRTGHGDALTDPITTT